MRAKKKSDADDVQRGAERFRTNLEALNQSAHSDESAKSRKEVMSDFRKIAGPLRGRNRDRKPKS